MKRKHVPITSSNKKLAHLSVGGLTCIITFFLFCDKFNFCFLFSYRFVDVIFQIAKGPCMMKFKNQIMYSITVVSLHVLRVETLKAYI